VERYNAVYILLFEIMWCLLDLHSIYAESNTSRLALCHVGTGSRTDSDKKFAKRDWIRTHKNQSSHTSGNYVNVVKQNKMKFQLLLSD